MQQYFSGTNQKYFCCLLTLEFKYESVKYELLVLIPYFFFLAVSFYSWICVSYSISFFRYPLSLSLFHFPSLLSLLSLAIRMECCLLTVCAVCAALLFVLFYWIVPAVQSNGMWALIWHDFITERLRDTLTRSTRPQVT